MKKGFSAGRVILRILLLLIIIMIFGGAIYYIYRANAYKSVFFEGTLVNGYEVGGLTPEQAEALLTEKIPTFTANIHFMDGSTEAITSEELDYAYVVGNEVRSIFASQNPLMWFPNLMATDAQTYDVQFPLTYNENTLRQKIVSFPQMQSDAMVAPVNATMDYADGAYFIVPEEDGTTFDAEAVTEDALVAVREAVGGVLAIRKETNAAGETVEHELVLVREPIDGAVADFSITDDYFAKAEIRSDDPALVGEMNRLNNLIKAHVTYELPGGEKREITPTMLHDWLETDATGKLIRKEETWRAKVEEFVATMCADVDTIDKPHLFKTHDGREITVPGTGYYGYKIDEEAEADALFGLLMAGDVVARTPEYQRMEASSPDDNYGFGQTYVEISIPEQRLIIYVDGQVVLDTLVVTGMTDGEHDTPTGAFFVYDKQTNKIMRGIERDENGNAKRKPNGEFVYEYEIPCKYWARLTNEGVGMHDYARGAYGGNIYRYDGSHGCINMSLSAAETMWNTVYDYMPVIIYNE